MIRTRQHHLRCLCVHVKAFIVSTDRLSNAALFLLTPVNSGFCFSSQEHGKKEVIWSGLTEAVPRSIFIGHPKWQSDARLWTEAD